MFVDLEQYGWALKMPLLAVLEWRQRGAIHSVFYSLQLGGDEKERMYYYTSRENSKVCS